MKRTLSWRVVIPSCFTFAALAAGVGSILAAAHTYFLLSAQLIMVALILDGLDGTLARLLRGQTNFGAELDTFVDITAFGIAPAVLLYMSVLQDFSIPGLVLTFLFVMSGASRLSRFRVVDPYRGQRGFLGLPITVAAGFVAVYTVATETAPSSWEWTFESDVLSWIFWLLLVIMLLLQVSWVRYPKTTKNPTIFAPFFVCLVCLFIRSAAPYSAAVMLTYGLWYVFVAPLFFRQVLLRNARQEAVFSEEKVS